MLELLRVGGSVEGGEETGNGFGEGEGGEVEVPLGEGASYDGGEGDDMEGGEARRGEEGGGEGGEVFRVGC